MHFLILEFYVTSVCACVYILQMFFETKADLYTIQFISLFSNKFYCAIKITLYNTKPHIQDYIYVYATVKDVLYLLINPRGIIICSSPEAERGVKVGVD